MSYNAINTCKQQDITNHFSRKINFIFSRHACIFSNEPITDTCPDIIKTRKMLTEWYQDVKILCKYCEKAFENFLDAMHFRAIITIEKNPWKTRLHKLNLMGHDAIFHGYGFLCSYQRCYFTCNPHCGIYSLYVTQFISLIVRHLLLSQDND